MTTTRSTSTGWLQDGGGVTRSTSTGWSQQVVATATLPTLSLPGVIDIGPTSARPQVTLTY